VGLLTLLQFKYQRRSVFGYKLQYLEKYLNTAVEVFATSVGIGQMFSRRSSVTDQL